MCRPVIGGLLEPMSTCFKHTGLLAAIKVIGTITMVSGILLDVSLLRIQDA